MGLEPAWMEAKSHNLPSMCISTIFLSESIALCARALSKCFKFAVEEKERTGKKWNLTRKLAPVTFLVKLRYYYRFFFIMIETLRQLTSNYYARVTALAKAAPWQLVIKEPELQLL